MKPLQVRYSRPHNLSMALLAAGMMGVSLLHFLLASEQAQGLTTNDPRFPLYIVLVVAMGYYTWAGFTRAQNPEPQLVIDHDGIALGFGRNRRLAWSDIMWVRQRRLGFRPQLQIGIAPEAFAQTDLRLSMWNLDDGLRPIRGAPSAVAVRDNGLDANASTMLATVKSFRPNLVKSLKERQAFMRRFIVGLLATIGTVTLLAVTGVVIFLVTGPLAPKQLPDSVVLSLDLRQVPSENPSSDLLSGGLWRDRRDLTETVQLLWQAAEDPRVVGLYVEIGDDSAGLARVQELRQAIKRFRGKGKFAIGFAEGLGGSGDHFADYYLASALDQIWLQPSGGFTVLGLAVETPFMRNGLDKLGVKIEGGKRWEFKSAPDSFTENGYTPAARENLQQLIDGLYGQFIEDVARERKVTPVKLRQLIDAAPFEADRALKEGLVDKLGYRADAMDDVWQRAGTTRDLIDLDDYAGDNRRPRLAGDVIALVRATGTITSGPGGAGLLGDDAQATAEEVVDALDLAAQSNDVKAIVLRIDSPGGTYPAADAMADGVARARAAGKPVIVSMGDMAASGGYLAAVRADVIVAQPGTITGSIGVFGIWPVASDLLDKLGVRVQRLGTGANAGMYSNFQPPNAQQRMAMNRELDAIYADFTRQVGEARKLDAGRLDAAARGRVFTGVDARSAGLVDELGGLQLALSIAKNRAGIDENQPVRLRRYPAPEDPVHKIIDRVLRLIGVEAAGPTIRAPREIREVLARLGITNRPGNVRVPPLPPLWK